MNLQPFKEELIKKIEKEFADQANLLLAAAESGANQQTSLIAGKIKGLHEAVDIIEQTYKAFTTQKRENDSDDERALY